MKSRRLLSLLFATCMLVAATLPAGAVSCTTEEAQLSENAGSTTKCQLVKFSDSGIVDSVIVDVAIPAGSTKAQETALVKSALLNAADVSAAPMAARGVMDLICEKEDVRLTSSSYTNVGSGTIPYADTLMLLVVFNNYLNLGADTLSVTVTGGKYSSKSYTMSADIASSSLTNVIAYMYTGTGNVFLTNGSSVSAKAKTNSGTFQADTCQMWVSQYDVAGNS